MIKVATLADVTHVAARMRTHDRAERAALIAGDDPVLAAVQFLHRPHVAVTVWREVPIAVIGVVFERPGVASTVFFATARFPQVALATTRFVRRTLFPILLNVGVHRLQVCSMDNLDDPDSAKWVQSFGARQEAFLSEYGKNKEDFRLFTLSKAGMARVTNVAN